MYHRRPRRRHGVLLLIVLCVLFMFLLLAITYAVVASKERSMTRNLARLERSSDPPNFLLDEIAMVLFRDTNDPHSPFRSWSLLEGIYGNVSFRGTLSAAPTAQAGGQFLSIPTTVANLTSGPGNTPNYFKGCVLTMLTGQCAGLSTRIVASSGTTSPPTITVMRFQADAGLYDPASGDTFLINGRPYCGMGRGYNTTGNANPGGLGTGLPFTNDAIDPSLSSTLPATVGGFYALLPNPTGFSPSANYTDPAGPGGANMGYTACDYNNCYLGLMLNNTTISQSGIIPSFFRPALYNYWNTQVPSLSSNAQLLRRITFRPNAVDHPAFFANTNPSFAAGNPASQFDVDNLGGGVPDSIWIDPGLPVMTARDGRTYKVLVAPCILDLDGRINVNAHGSLLNYDTNVSPTTQNGVTATSSSSAFVGIAGIGVGSLSGANAQPIGQGYGPAEINLNGIFSPAEVKGIIEGTGNWSGRYGGVPASPFSQFPNYQYDRPLELLKFFEYPISTNQADNPLLTQTTFMSPPDLKGRRLLVLDPRGQPNFLTPGSIPQNSTYWTHEVQGSGTSAESPYSFRLDRSVPRPARYISTVQIDNQFTVGELETCLRQYDADRRTLPQRLYSILTSLQTNANQRNKVTTESWDYPGAGLQVPRSLRAGLATSGYRAFGITDLLYAKFQQNCPALAGNTNEIVKLLPPEMIAGLRMDINRPFGNGRADTAGGVPDSPGGISSNNPSAPDANPETWKSNGSTTYPSQSGYAGNVPMNLVNWNSSINPADPLMSSNLPVGVQARQLMARQLYALMMLFADQQFTGWSVDPSVAPGSVQAQQLTARRIAQWAINAVSFRDATSIMTPFVYHWDIYQSSYQGWTVDGDPGDTANLSSTNGKVGIVWGCKPPDAVLTETLAFHDKRIADTNWDTGNNGVVNGAVKSGTPPPDQGGSMPGTPNFDQTRIPQGSLFLELTCTRNPNTAFCPSDLYTLLNPAAAWNVSTNPWCLNLSKLAPDNNPVWRIVISKSAKLNPTYDVLTQSTTYPDTTTFEPTTDPTVATSNPIVAQSCQQMNILDPTKNVPVERVIWLGGTAPNAAIRASLSPGWPCAPGTQIYYNRTGNVLVPPGSYAVIGPRPITYLGSAGTYTTAGQWGKPSLQAITLTPGINVTNPAGTSTMPTSGVKTSPYQAIGVIVAADPPPTATWSNSTAYTAQAAAGIGVSVSEPFPAPLTAASTSGYYPQPTVANAALASVYDAYDDLTQKTHAAGANGYPDQPLEEGIGQPTTQQLPLLQDLGTPGTAASSGTYGDYKTVFLQRLADPTSGYDAQRNPYITVDWMPVDLTIFNGEDPSPNPNDHAKTITLASRQRGGSSPVITSPFPNPTYNLWTPIQLSDTLPTTTAAAAGTTANFTMQLNHTLGTLNHAFGAGMISGSATGQAVSTQYVGDPIHPFPWIDWNARPYVSTMELLNVPASAPNA